MALSDIYQKASLVQIPSGYKSGTLYSVVPNTSSGDFTIDSDADATRVNKDGLIETTVANQARLNYDFSNPQDPHLLLEPTRTNYATNNSSMDTYGTVDDSSPSPTLTADYTTAPDGSNTATRFQATITGSNYSLIQFPSTALGDGTYYIGVYAKSNTGSNQTISFYGDSSPTNAHTVTPEWTRIIVEATRGAGLTKYAYLGTWASQHGSDASIDISLWGAQIEVDSSYATSLIPTLGSAVTRTKDRCTGGGDSNLFNDNEGVLFVDIEALADNDTNFRYISLSDGTATNAILIQYRNNGDLRIYNGGTGTSNLIFSDFGINQTVRKKIAIQYGTTANDYKVYIDGVSKTVSGSFTATAISGLDRFRFDYATDGLEFFSKVHQAIIFNEALTDAELITLTT